MISPGANQEHEILKKLEGPVVISERLREPGALLGFAWSPGSTNDGCRAYMVPLGAWFDEELSIIDRPAGGGYASIREGVKLGSKTSIGERLITKAVGIEGVALRDVGSMEGGLGGESERSAVRRQVFVSEQLPPAGLRRFWASTERELDWSGGIEEGGEGRIGAFGVGGTPWKTSCDAGLGIAFWIGGKVRACRKVKFLHLSSCGELDIFRALVCHCESAHLAAAK